MPFHFPDSIRFQPCLCVRCSNIMELTFWLEEWTPLLQQCPSLAHMYCEHPAGLNNNDLADGLMAIQHAVPRVRLHLKDSPKYEF